MRRHFHNLMISLAAVGLLISLFGIMPPPENSADSHPSKDIAAQEIDALITEEQHKYQYETRYQLDSTLPPPEPSVVTHVESSGNSGIIVWEYPEGVENITSFAVEDWVVSFRGDRIRSIDRERFRHIAHEVIERGTTE